MTIRSIIIDDEHNNVENLQLIVKQYFPEIVVVATASGAAEGLTAIQQHQPDLVFLDIQMPVASGFDMLKGLTEIKFEIVFITAYDKYALQAIKVSALDYLLKPIDIGEFRLAVDKVKQKVIARQQNHRIEHLMEYIKAGQKENSKIALPTLQETMYVRIADILRCESSNNYTNFYLYNGERVLVCKTLKEVSEILKPHKFIRTHQSHLVNAEGVKSYLREDGGTLLLTDGTKIPISRQNRDAVKEALNGN
jgi:two-component system LytT family response regulator